MAGPFTREDFDHLVPADKKLSPDWVKSLFARGTPEVLRGSELKFVGMPVGGIGAGQLYLGGDGRLWHWDIFNQPGKRPTGDGTLRQAADARFAADAKIFADRSATRRARWIATVFPTLLFAANIRLASWNTPTPPCRWP